MLYSLKEPIAQIRPLFVKCNDRFHSYYIVYTEFQISKSNWQWRYSKT